MKLTSRQRKILGIIIKDFINKAEPVSSRTIAKNYNLGISAATVRNEMSDLEEMGYLEQPHTSAGRIPTQKGYRFYVDQLMPIKSLTQKERDYIDTGYHQALDEIDNIVQQTAKIISHIIPYTSMVSHPHMKTNKYIHGYLVSLDGFRVLLVLITELGTIEKKILEFPFGIQEKKLDEISVLLNKYFKGMSLKKIECYLISILEQEIVERQAAIIMKKIMKGIEENSFSPEKIYLGGAANILDIPEFKDRGKVKKIIEFLEEEHLMSCLLDKEQNNKVIISIGSENESLPIKDCSLVTATYHLNGQLIGKIGVLGPTRMEYDKVVAVVDYISTNIENIFKNILS